jgi:hypothetical protein
MFQKIKFYDGQELEGWQPFLKELSKDNAKGILLFVGEETPFDYKQLQPLLLQTTATSTKKDGYCSIWMCFP